MQQAKYTNAACSFGGKGLLESGTDMVKQYVGSCDGGIYPNYEGTEMEFIINNDTHLKSLLYHYFELNEYGWNFPEEYKRIEGTITPLGEINQIIKWTEPIDNNRFEQILMNRE